METIEEHSSGLVNLLQLCQQHNLNPLTHDKDPPHAKVASDIMSCLFMVRKTICFSSYFILRLLFQPIYLPSTFMKTVTCIYKSCQIFKYIVLYTVKIILNNWLQRNFTVQWFSITVDLCCTECIIAWFQHYSKAKVMMMAIPVVVNFLSSDNKELSRNVSSYLSLAALDNADLLARHMEIILNSIFRGQYLLCLLKTGVVHNV